MEKEIKGIDAYIADHEHIQNYIGQIEKLIANLIRKNELYKREIFENELEIRKLKDD